MKNIKQIKLLEMYNKEYLKLYHSKVVRFQRNMSKIKNNKLKDNIRLVKRKITAKIGDIKIKLNVKSANYEKTYYNFGKPLENIKIAVYACITNGYDTIKEPLYLENDTEYFLYTDDKYTSNKDSNWIQKKIDCSGYENEANRYYKFHPDLFEKNYDFAIYIDGNVRIISDVTTLCYIARKSKTGIAMHKHHNRDCVYQEGLACKYYKRGNLKEIQNKLLQFKKEGFPEKFGLCEATIIVYDLKNPLAKKIAHNWWEQYYQSGTKRDQIFFPYIIWKEKLLMLDVGDLGNNLWENPKFIITGHD